MRFNIEAGLTFFFLSFFAFLSNYIQRASSNVVMRIMRFPNMIAWKFSFSSKNKQQRQHGEFSLRLVFFFLLNVQSATWQAHFRSSFCYSTITSGPQMKKVVYNLDIWILDILNSKKKCTTWHFGHLPVHKGWGLGKHPVQTITRYTAFIRSLMTMGQFRVSKQP